MKEPRQGPLLGSQTPQLRASKVGALASPEHQSPGEGKGLGSYLSSSLPGGRLSS